MGDSYISSLVCWRGFFLHALCLNWTWCAPKHTTDTLEAAFLLSTAVVHDSAFRAREAVWTQGLLAVCPLHVHVISVGTTTQSEMTVHKSALRYPGRVKWCAPRAGNQPKLQCLLTHQITLHVPLSGPHHILMHAYPVWCGMPGCIVTWQWQIISWGMSIQPRCSYNIWFLQKLISASLRL